MIETWAVLGEGHSLAPVSTGLLGRRPAAGELRAGLGSAACQNRAPGQVAVFHQRMNDGVFLCLSDASKLK